MEKNLFISASNGIYMLNIKNNTVVCVMNKKHTKGLFKKQSKGYFGICNYSNSNKILVSSRERLSLLKYNKPTTGTKLFEIDTQSLTSKHVATISDIHDAHQIYYKAPYIYITDTGKNRVVVFDIAKKQVVKYFNIGGERNDIHHINAILIDDEQLLIGLNNRGNESQILSVDLDVVLSAQGVDVDLDSYATIKTLSGVTHSHDLEPSGDILLCCSSHKGLVLNTDTGEPIISADMWVRGLADDNESSLWVGASFIASRKDRHGKEINGKIHKYSKKNWGLVHSYSIAGSGQINDLLFA